MNERGWNDAERYAQKHTAAPLDRWAERADENIEEWGDQSVETLLLAIQEEVGEVTQAVLEYRAEDGNYGEVFAEIDDLAPLIIQLHEAVSDYRLDHDPMEGGERGW